jgi:hypothetical protein
MHPQTYKDIIIIALELTRQGAEELPLQRTQRMSALTVNAGEKLHRRPEKKYIKG